MQHYVRRSPFHTGMPNYSAFDGGWVRVFLTQRPGSDPQVFLSDLLIHALGKSFERTSLPEIFHNPHFGGLAYNPRDFGISLAEGAMASKTRRKTKVDIKPMGTLLPFPGSENMFGDAPHDTEATLKSERQAIQPRPGAVGGIDELDVVICGTFRKDIQGLRHSFEHLKDLGFNILSPSNVDIVAEDQGFVYMRGEQTETPDTLELRHLEAIERARLIWLHAPDGYVGPTAALELGFAKASGIPVFSTANVADVALRSFVTVVSSPEEVLNQIAAFEVPPPPPGLKPFQNYYRRAAAQRGYEKESTQNCLLLMVEEVGELARALRKKQRLTRHGSAIVNVEALELADVFMYVIHMANILKVDLGHVVQQKELLNIEKLLQRT